MNMRALLSQHLTSVSVNELLDLFEVYVSTIGAPLTKAVNLIGEELNYHEGDIFSHIVGVVNDADDMAKLVKKIRAGYHADAGVTITLSTAECRQLDTAIPDIVGLLDDTVRGLDLLAGGFETGSIDQDQPATASVLRLFSRALRGADELEIPPLLQLDNRLRKSVSARLEARRQADLCEESAA